MLLYEKINKEKSIGILLYLTNSKAFLKELFSLMVHVKIKYYVEVLTQAHRILDGVLHSQLEIGGLSNQLR